MKKIFTFFTFLMFLSISACQKVEINTDENKTISLDEKSARLIEAGNEFGLEIFQKIRSETKDENIMVSPLSISVALAMAYNGANGDTKTEMEKVLRLYGLTPEEINASYKMLIEALQSVDKDVVFEIANSIFYANGFSVKPGFLNVNKNYYDAEVESLDFSSSAAVKTINDWVSDKTHQKIKKIIDSLSPDSRMVLINAIYFNGIWASEFDKDGTKMRSFYKNENSNYEVAMMNKEDKLEYSSNSLFEAVKIPYGKGQYNMVVMRPAEGKNSRDLISQLNAANWKEWAKNFKTEDLVVITMPRFKFEFESDLNEVLKEMGIKKAFQTTGADFSKISDVYLYISKIKHKSFIDVNETGTEAAADTSVTFETTSAGPGDLVKKIYFTVDKPFVFAITEKDTNAILFIGEVQNPEYKN